MPEYIGVVHIRVQALNDEIATEFLWERIDSADTLQILDPTPDVNETPYITQISLVEVI